MYRIDPYTKEKFIPQRKNQVYKNRNTQIQYHNERRKLLRLAKTRVERQLHLNWAVLHDIYMGNVEPTDEIPYMEQIGFDTSFHTHRKGHYKVIYNYGFIIKGNTVEVIKLTSNL